MEKRSKHREFVEKQKREATKERKKNLSDRTLKGWCEIILGKRGEKNEWGGEK